MSKEEKDFKYAQEMQSREEAEKIAREQEEADLYGVEELNELERGNQERAEERRRRDAEERARQEEADLYGPAYEAPRAGAGGDRSSEELSQEERDTLYAIELQEREVEEAKRDSKNLDDLQFAAGLQSSELDEAKKRRLEELKNLQYALDLQSKELEEANIDHQDLDDLRYALGVESRELEESVLLGQESGAGRRRSEGLSAEEADLYGPAYEGPRAGAGDRDAANELSQEERDFQYAQELQSREESETRQRQQQEEADRQFAERLSQERDGAAMESPDQGARARGGGRIQASVSRAEAIRSSQEKEASNKTKTNTPATSKMASRNRGGGRGM